MNLIPHSDLCSGVFVLTPLQNPRATTNENPNGSDAILKDGATKASFACRSQLRARFAVGEREQIFGDMLEVLAAGPDLPLMDRLNAIAQRLIVF